MSAHFTCCISRQRVSVLQDAKTYIKGILAKWNRDLGSAPSARPMTIISYHIISHKQCTSYLNMALGTWNDMYIPQSKSCPCGIVMDIAIILCEYPQYSFQLNTCGSHQKIKRFDPPANIYLCIWPNQFHSNTPAPQLPL